MLLFISYGGVGFIKQSKAQYKILLLIEIDSKWCFTNSFPSLRFLMYMVIHKSLRDFLPLLYSSRDGHAEGQHVNRGRDTPSFCPTLQVLDTSTLGNAADVNPVIKFLPHTVNHVS
jgi:hypothetical protein